MGPLRDLSESFFKILVINFRLVVFFFCGIFRAEVMKFVWKIFLIEGMYNFPGSLAGPFRDLSQFICITAFNFLMLAFIIFAIFRAKMIKL